MWKLITHTLLSTEGNVADSDSDGPELEHFVEEDFLLDLVGELMSLRNSNSLGDIGLKGRLRTSVLIPLFQSLCYPDPDF